MDIPLVPFFRFNSEIEVGGLFAQDNVVGTPIFTSEKEKAPNQEIVPWYQCYFVSWDN